MLSRSAALLQGRVELVVCTGPGVMSVPRQHCIFYYVLMKCAFHAAWLRRIAWVQFQACLLTDHSLCECLAEGEREWYCRDDHADFLALMTPDPNRSTVSFLHWHD